MTSAAEEARSIIAGTETSTADILAATSSADEAFASYRATNPAQRADFLEGIAD